MFEVSFPAGTALSNGVCSSPLLAIDFVMDFRREQRDIPLEHGSFAGAHIAYAIVDKYLGGKAIVTMLQAEPNTSRMSMEFDEHVHPDALIDIGVVGEHLDQLRITRSDSID